MAKQRYVYYVDTRGERGSTRGVYRNKRAMLRWVEWALQTRGLDTVGHGELHIGRIPVEVYDRKPEAVNG